MRTEEFLAVYEKLDPIGRANVLTHAKFALDIQENTERRCRDAAVRAQEAMKADYGLVAADAPLFNGTGAVSSPAYVLQGAEPEMEAVNA